MQEVFEKIKERVCEFIHERNKSGSVPCKNQRASCLQLIRVCDLTAIVNQVAEEYNHCALCYLQSPCEYQNEDINVGGNDGWIPCSERLPELKNSYTASESVLVTDIKGSIWTAEYHESGIWVDDVVDIRLNVIAWQPLPEPYQPKGENNV